MHELGVDVADRVPHRLDRADAEWADVVVTMGCGDACPYIPGKRYIDWGFTDPKGLPIEQVREIRDEILSGSPSSWPSWTRPGRPARRRSGDRPREPPPQPERDVDEGHEHRHLDQRAHDPGERLAGLGAEDADRDGDCELEVVARDRERQRRRLGIGEADGASGPEAEEPHDGEVHEQRQRDPRDRERVAGDGVALDREQQHDREQEAVERDRADPGNELRLVPFEPAAPDAGCGASGTRL